VNRLTVISVQDVSFQFGDEPLFSHVTFQIAQGDFVAIVGSNGTGKSTLLRMMIGDLPARSGHISLFDTQLSKFRQFTRIGYIPQKGIQAFSGFPATVEEIVVSGLYSKIGKFRLPGKSHKALAYDALQKVGMEASAKKLVSELSGGQQQRVLLAKTLVNPPDLLLLDEPTTGIDDETIEAIYTLLSNINKEQEMTICMVTHDTQRASQWVSRILCLEEGSILELDKETIAQELSHKHKHPHFESGGHHHA
jgi:zinc transport system ATP-binding protein